MLLDIVIEDLSADLIPLISDPEVHMVLVEIISLDLVKSVDRDLQVDIGSIGVKIIEVFSGQSLRPGMAMHVPVKRVSDPAIRVRNNVNQWNNLALNRGSLLILACSIDKINKQCRGLAATQVASSSSADVLALRKCYEIERYVRASKPHRELFQSALTGLNDLLFYYALDAAVRRGVFGRDNGLAVIDLAMWSKETSGERKRELARTLTESRFFDIGYKADQINVNIISILAKGLISEHELDKRLDWARRLSSTVLGELSPERGEDQALRMKLLRSVQNPQPAEVIKVLEKMEKMLAGGDREIVQELIAAWRQAM